jgi:Tfp pilus assembly protein PilW
MQLMYAELGRFWAWLNRNRRVAGAGLVEYALHILLLVVLIVGALIFLSKANDQRTINVACKVQNTRVNANPACS